MTNNEAETDANIETDYSDLPNYLSHFCLAICHPFIDACMRTLAQCIYIMYRCTMHYTWNEDKNRRNIERHGIAFKDAVRIFDGPTVEQMDARFDYGEIRVYAIGLAGGLEITVIYTDTDNDERRIISAWRAEPHERRYYWQHLDT